VVAEVATLAAAQGSTQLAMTNETVLALPRKFGDAALRDRLEEINLYAGEWKALTESEGRYLLKFSSLEPLRNKVLKEGLGAGPSNARTTFERRGQDLPGLGFSLGQLDFKGFFGDADPSDAQKESAFFYLPYSRPPIDQR